MAIRIPMGVIRRIAAGAQSQQRDTHGNKELHHLECSVATIIHTLYATSKKTLKKVIRCRLFKNARMQDARHHEE
jgi:hypothetical protein